MQEKFMKQKFFLVIALVATLVLSACGGQESAEQVATGMPTPIPTYTPQAANAADQGNAPAAEVEISEAEVDANQEEAVAAVVSEDEEPTAEPTAIEEPTAEAIATKEPTVEAIATEEPTVEATATEEVAEAVADDPLAGLPAGVAAAMADADPNRGEQLTIQNACTGCHTLDPDVMMVGPTWHNLAETAANRVEGQNAAEYLYYSIIDPNDYVVEGFPLNVMLQIYADTLSDQDLADLVTYLLNAEQ
jgi:mono/diheme cytochrome c family protein